MRVSLLGLALMAAACGGDDNNPVAPAASTNRMSFFVTSVERDPSNGNNPTDARSRIGNGPWVNAASRDESTRSVL